MAMFVPASPLFLAGAAGAGAAAAGAAAGASAFFSSGAPPGAAAGASLFKDEMTLDKASTRLPFSFSESVKALTYA